MILTIILTITRTIVILIVNTVIRTTIIIIIIRGGGGARASFPGKRTITSESENPGPKREIVLPNWVDTIQMWEQILKPLCEL